MDQGADRSDLTSHDEITQIYSKIVHCIQRQIREGVAQE